MFKVGTRSSIVGAIAVAVVLLAGCTTPLTLQNGWTNGAFGASNAGFGNVQGIVHFKGAISTAGTNPFPFTLPAGARPATNVYVHIGLCNANNGRLVIRPTGDVEVQAEGAAFSNAQCFTSLDGASFALDTTGFTNLSLQNGWTNTPFGTSNAAVRTDGNIVHFKGAIGTAGNVATAFFLPAQFRPATDVYVPVDLCNTTKGRLHIRPTGDVIVEAAGSVFANAQCFTSLDGASFALDTTGFTNLSLQNGWTNAPFGTSNAAVRADAGIVHFKGAIFNGTNTVITTLPTNLRPMKPVWIPVDLCNAKPGRLIIDTNGEVQVHAQDVFLDAQCFTSLDGASFARNP